MNEFVNNSLLLNNMNIYNKIPIEKLKYFLENIREDKQDNKGHQLLANNLLIDIKREFNEYQYYLLMNNKLEIPDSAILGGIIDEYDIMKHYKDKNNNFILVILNNEKYKNECIKGNGIIFKTRTNYINSRNIICQINFFDIEKYEKDYPNNIELIKKIRKIKELNNVIIFPKNSLELFEKLAVDDISKQEFFICWNKNLNLEKIIKQEPNEDRERPENANNEESVSYNELKNLLLRINIMKI
jgi:hypothetical protein